MGVTDNQKALEEVCLGALADLVRGVASTSWRRVVETEDQDVGRRRHHALRVVS